MSDVLALARPEIRALAPVHTHVNGAATLTRLHANENPWTDECDRSPTALNRYTDGTPQALLRALAQYYGRDDSEILVTRGSDEAIDFLVRAFCRAGQDSILVCPPTFSMYGFSAAVQGAAVKAVPLTRKFDLDADAVVSSWTPAVKLVFLCTPNNPTGNAFTRAAVLRVLSRLSGRAVIVVDEAYAEFSNRDGYLSVLDRNPGLVILRTLSKAHGLAGARCGVALASATIVDLLSRMMSPYALVGPSVATALAALRPERVARTQERIRRILEERERLRRELTLLPAVAWIWPSEANFLLVEFHNARRALEAARREGLLLRDLTRHTRLEGCLRITVGSPKDNDRLLAALAK